MYNVQCSAGHVFEAPTGSNLEKLCIEREQKGVIDALPLSAEECCGCRNDRQRDLRREANLCVDVGCPMGEGDCKGGCLVLQELHSIRE